MFTKPDLIYPESDGQPMADNTEQFRWIVQIKENLELLFADVEDVFVAGDLLWYPVQNAPNIRKAPDAMVVFGRPKGRRGSYLQWKENNIPPQVVFEILSPSNSSKEMSDKLEFYELYGVEEYYIYDPDNPRFTGWLREGDRLQSITSINNWVSPRLGIRFDISGVELQIYRPDGRPFIGFIELDQQLLQQEQRANLESQRAETERLRAETERLRAEMAEGQLQQEQQLRQVLEAKLRELGIDPNQL